MTREEANNIARGITDKIEATTDIDDWAEFWGFTRDDYEEFLDVAIEALSTEPCEDCISRQAVIDINHNHYGEMPNHINHQIWEEINALPSIQSKPKTDVLDKIRAEIEHLTITEGGEDYVRTMAELYSLKIKVLQIIDKYRTEREDKK